jgi:hypothetical protein
MKKYLTFLLLIAAIGANAQTMIKVKSKNLTLNDSLWMPKYGQEIVNIPANALGDSVRSVDILAHITSDTTINIQLELRYYDKSGSLLTTVKKDMPASVYSKWTALQTKLYTWIFLNTKRLAKQN